MNINELQSICLFFLMENPNSGYDLTKIIKKTNAWHASHQQIYRELGKLEGVNFVTFADVPQVGKPDRKVYSITPVGKQALQTYQKSVDTGFIKLNCKLTVMALTKNVDYLTNKKINLLSQYLNKSKLISIENSDSDIESLLLQREISHIKADIDFIDRILNTL